jgi:archaellum component FlaC
MTLQELERGMELHEQRMARIERGMELHEQRMARIESNIELHEQRFKRIEDNLVVQGELLNRLDQRVDRIASFVEKNSLEMGFMQATLASLLQRMDAFIRGLERRNGHEKPGSA